ncbi:TetR/AcrR family transcriptional regulator [Plantactinospora sp. S1510]|uniref:TetR/AcrR family transcriptional regulator n=1 Tax=Plantactinospora alkalitolerans TaxID=2789879 RepID=A0ABS0H5L0_9ACTN|nr:TetR/AcrR family transcriptional regulator [Plantactinospora alkalitolerans]MBF9133727.1 TetR/AcrR family transcriptional regulator [Plantactinospora alkalitolerans]
MPHAAARSVRRADARQNAEKIVQAAVSRLGRDAEASMNDIAGEAGVGRVTLYGHFPSRQALVEAALVRLLSQGEDVLAAIDLTGDPRDGLRTLMESGWLLLAQAASVLLAAQATLPPGRVQELHAKPERRVHNLIRRGQTEGVFRADIPADLLASTLHHILHGAATDVAAGRLDATEAPRFVAEMTLAICAVPPAPPQHD